jgi:hypothetical protein
LRYICGTRAVHGRIAVSTADTARMTAACRFGEWPEIVTGDHLLCAFFKK